jgi:hypothetical protein
MAIISIIGMASPTDGYFALNVDLSEDSDGIDTLMLVADIKVESPSYPKVENPEKEFCKLNTLNVSFIMNFNRCGLLPYLPPLTLPSEPRSLFPVEDRSHWGGNSHPRCTVPWPHWS